MSESYSVSIGVSANGVQEAISQLQQLDDLLGKINGNTATVSVQLSEDVINRKPINTVLYEKEKWEPKDGETNG